LSTAKPLQELAGDFNEDRLGKPDCHLDGDLDRDFESDLDRDLDCDLDRDLGGDVEGDLDGGLQSSANKYLIAFRIPLQRGIRNPDGIYKNKQKKQQHTS